MEIRFIKVYVKNQDEALAIYTSKLGCTKKADLAMGTSGPGRIRFLTVEPAGSTNKVQIILEKIGNDITRQFVEAQYADGDPAYSINTDDIVRDLATLKTNGVTVVDEPSDIGPAIFATIDDGCGHYVYLVQSKS